MDPNIQIFSRETIQSGLYTDQDIFEIAELRTLYTSNFKIDTLMKQVRDTIVGNILWGDMYWLYGKSGERKGIIFGEMKGAWFESDGVYVLPSSRKHLIGSALKEAQKETLKQKLDCIGIKTSIENSNTKSIALNRKAGFDVRYDGGAGLMARFNFQR